MKFKHLAIATTLALFFCVITTLGYNSIQAQTSSDTNLSYSVNQSYYWQHGLKPATTPIVLQGGGATKNISVINQNPQSLLEVFLYTLYSPYARIGFIQDSPKFSNPQNLYGDSPATVPFPSTGIFPGGGMVMPQTYLPSAASGFSTYNTTASFLEDTLINQISSTGFLKINGTDGNGNILPLSVPMTNCAQVSGTGSKKVVFMRTADWNSDLNDYLWYIDGIIKKLTAPGGQYGSNTNQLSFYVDLRKIPSNGYLYDTISPLSSCGKGALSYVLLSSNGLNKLTFSYSDYKGTVTVSVIGTQLPVPALEVSKVNNSNIALTWTTSSSDEDGFKIFRKLGKNGAFSQIATVGKGVHNYTDTSPVSGNLNYYSISAFSTTGNWQNSDQSQDFLRSYVDITPPSVPVLSLRPFFIFQKNNGVPQWVPMVGVSWNEAKDDDDNYGDGTFVALGYNLYRYDQNNVKTTIEPRFRWNGGASYNDGSVEIFNPANFILKVGSTYCYTASAFDQILPRGVDGESFNTSPGNVSNESSKVCITIPNPPDAVAAAPQVNPPTAKTFNAGSSMSVSGSGFSPSGNNVRITKISPSSFNSESEKSLASLLDLFISHAEAQTTSNVYFISNIASNGTSLSFNLPQNLPSGTYELEVAAQNGDWAIVTSQLKVQGSAGGTVTLPTDGGGSSSQTAATISYSCGKGYTLTADNQCYKPAVVQQGATTWAADATYSCPSGYTLSGPNCVAAGSSFLATITYSCRTGWTLSGTLCNVPAGYVWTAASTVAPNVTYSCKSGYRLDAPSATTCHLDTSPQNLAADTSAGVVSLSWNASSARQESGFSVERSSGSSGKFAVVGTVGSGVLSYSDTTVVSGQKYSYRVRAQFSDGTFSDYSNTLLAAAIKVSVPKAKTTVKSASEILVSWTDADPGITAYRLSGTSNGYMTLSQNLASFTDTGLLPKTKYCYSVKAVLSSDATIQSATSTSVCTTTQTPKMSLSAPSGSQQSLTSSLSVINSNNAAHISSVDLYVGKNTTPFATSKTLSGIPFNVSTLTTGKYKVYAVVHFDSGTTFKTKSITVQVKNSPSQTSLNKTIAPDGDSSDSDAVYTDTDGSTEDVSAENGDTGGNSSNSPVVIASPTQINSVDIVQTPTASPAQTPTTAVASPILNPTVSVISGPAQLNVGDTAKWTFSASDPLGSPMTYSIDWGDSSGPANSAVPSFKHSYANAGTYTITATAKNSSGLTGQNGTMIVVSSPTAAVQTPTTPAPVVVTSGPVSVNASLVDASSDKVGVWNVWGPGPGRANGNNPYDWHWSATVSNASGKTLSYVTVIMNGVRQGWSSSASTNNAFGVQLYPLVISAPGFITTAADQTYPIASGQVTLDIYGQPENPVGTTFGGATLTIGFTDGTSATAQIQSSSTAIPAMTSSMLGNSRSSGTANALSALSQWLTSIFGR